MKGRKSFWHRDTLICYRLLITLLSVVVKGEREGGGQSLVNPSSRLTTKGKNPFVKTSRLLVFHQRKKEKSIEILES